MAPASPKLKRHQRTPMTGELALTASAKMSTLTGKLGKKRLIEFSIYNLEEKRRMTIRSLTHRVIQTLVLSVGFCVYTAASAQSEPSSSKLDESDAALSGIPLSLEGHRIVDLSPRMVARIKRLNGDIEEGKPDAYGLPWILEEGVAKYDNTLFTFIGGWEGDKVWPYRISPHFGAHTEMGKGHIGLWEGLPDDMKELWEMPLETFFGTAAVCNFEDVKPVDGKGQALLPEHFANVRKGDIVLMCSPYRGAEQPYLPASTSKWLAEEKQIKMLAVEVPGIVWEVDAQAPSPNNSPTHRNMMQNNIPVTYPLTNISTLKKERVFYIGMPLNVVNLEASFVRALVFEEK